MRLTLRVRALLLVAAALAAGAARARAQTIPISVGGSLTSIVGSPVDAPIIADMSARPERLGAFTARLTWDPAVLRLDATIPGDFGGATVAIDSIAQGILRVAGANAGGYAGVVVLGTLRFTPLTGGTSALTLTVSELVAAVSFANLLPSAAVTSGSYCGALGLYGDMNQDAVVNSADALVAVTHAVGLPTGAAVIALGDVDADGATGTRDALGMLSYAVGLPTPGFRILQTAGGACSANPPLTIAIVPGAPGALLPTQTLELQARVTDPSGAPQSASGIVWKTTNPAAVTVDSVGQAVAVAPGSATVWAVRSAVDSAQLALTVVPARTRHLVDAAALNAVNQLGTAALPFGSLAGAAQFAAAGDTLDIQPGRYDAATFNQRVVLLGHPAGPNEVIIGGAGGGSYGLSLTGLGLSEVHSLAIEGFATALQVTSVDTVIVDSLRVELRGVSVAGCNTGIRVYEAWRVEVRRSLLVGDGASGCSTGLRVDGNVRTLVVDSLAVSDFGYAAISTGGGGGGVDSMVVSRTRLSDNGEYGVYAYNSGTASGRIPPTTSVAFIADSTRVERNGYEAMYVYDLRSARIAHSTIDTRSSGSDALELYASPSLPGYVQLVGDSILLNDSYWFYGSYLDSVTVDSVRAVGASEGYFDGVDYVRATTSSFTQTTNGTLFNLYPNQVATGTLVMDSVTVSGAAACSHCMNAVYGDGFGGTLNRLRIDNFNTGVHVFDSSLAVTNSVFAGGGTAIQTTSDPAAPKLLSVSGVQFTDVQYPIESVDNVASVNNVTITNAYDGIDLSGAGVDSVRNTTVTNSSSYAVQFNSDTAYADHVTVSGAEAGIYAYGGPAVITNSSISGAGYLGIAGDGPQTPTATDSVVVAGNTVDCMPNASYGVLARFANVRVEGNVITGGCYYGIDVTGNATSPAPAATIRANTVTMGPSVYRGIWLEGGTMRGRIVGNTVTGAGSQTGDGAIRVGTYGSQRPPFALVDSNTVQGSYAWGIRVEYVDSVEVRGNLLEDVVSYSSGQDDRGAIGVANATYALRVAGNTVRRARYAGIAADQQLYYFDPLDTATVFVDSNAVSASDTAAVLFQAGTLSMRHNNIRNNVLDGVHFAQAPGANSIMRDNAFQGNGLYAVNNPSLSFVDINDNWWGVDGMPPGSPGTDSTLGAFDDVPLLASPTNLPPLAPPALSPISAMAVSAGAGALRAVATTRGGSSAAALTAAPHLTLAQALARREEQERARAERAAALQAARSAHGLASSPPSPAPAAMMRALERLQRRARLEAQHDAARAARDSARAQQRQQQMSARGAAR